MVRPVVHRYGPCVIRDSAELALATRVARGGHSERRYIDSSVADLSCA